MKSQTLIFKKSLKEQMIMSLQPIPKRKTSRKGKRCMNAIRTRRTLDCANRQCDQTCPHSCKSVATQLKFSVSDRLWSMRTTSDQCYMTSICTRTL